MKNRTIFIIPVIIFMNSCLKNKIELPDEVLPVVNKFNLEDVLFDTKAFSINDEGSIVGYTETYYGPLTRYYERENHAFHIKADKSGYHDISLPGAHSTWPASINNNNIVAGAWLPKDYETNENLNNIPCNAYCYDLDNKTFKMVEVEGSIYCFLKKINNENMALGYYGNDPEFFLDQKSFIYHYNDATIENVEIEGCDSVYIVNLCDKYFVANVQTNTSDSITIIYDFTLKKILDTIPLWEIPYPDVEITDINNNGQLIGSFVDLSGENFGFQGFTYTIGDKNLNLITIKPHIKKWDYIEFNPRALNDDGAITGTAYRTESGFLPQARAFAMNWDLTGFNDITPENRETYGEAYDINNSNIIVGYAGFMQKKVSILNRAFVVYK